MKKVYRFLVTPSPLVETTSVLPSRHTLPVKTFQSPVKVLEPWSLLPSLSSFLSLSSLPVPDSKEEVTQ